MINNTKAIIAYIKMINNIRHEPGGSRLQGIAPTGEGCDSVLCTYVVQADGIVASCCGIGSRLINELMPGNIKDSLFLSKTLQESEEDFLKLALYHLGPEKLLAWVSEKNPSIKWENMYAHKCQACIRLYKDPIIKDTIISHYQELYAEVIFQNWFDEEYFYKSFSDNSVESTMD